MFEQNRSVTLAEKGSGLRRVPIICKMECCRAVSQAILDPLEAERVAELTEPPSESSVATYKICLGNGRADSQVKRQSPKA